jgi:hypothetical protein
LCQVVRFHFQWQLQRKDRKEKNFGIFIKRGNMQKMTMDPLSLNKLTLIPVNLKKFGEGEEDDTEGFLLLESGDHVLLETGDSTLKE